MKKLYELSKLVVTIHYFVVLKFTTTILCCSISLKKKTKCSRS